MKSWTRRQQGAFVALWVVVGLTRFLALSRGPWDWDEVLFCMAIDDYDVASHRPHPPGFPLHVLLGRMARLFVQSDFTALQTVNVLAGLAVFPLVFSLALILGFRFEASLGAAVVFAFLPNVWFYGGTAFSDLPATVLSLAAVAAFLAAGTSRGRYVLACAIGGAALLYRPHQALMLVFPWALATWRLVRARQWAGLVAGAIAGLSIAGLGYGVAIADVGFDRYVEVVRVHGRAVAMTDGLGSPGRMPLLPSIVRLLDPYQAGKVSLLLNALALAGVLAGRRRIVSQILLIFVPVFVFTVVATNPLGSSRMALGYVAGIVLLATEGAFVPGRWLPRGQLPIAGGLLMLIVGRLVPWTLPAFEVPRRTDPPHVRAVEWLRRNASATAPVVFDHSMYPWVHYYLADRPLVRLEDAFEKEPRPDLSGSWLVSVGEASGNQFTVFRRPRNRTWNIVTPRGFEVFVRPVESIARFGDGWYGAEADGQWRWAGRRSVMSFPAISRRREVTLQLSVPVDVLGSTELRFTFNGQLVRAVQVTSPETTVRLVLTPAAGGKNLLEIASSRSLVPARIGAGGDFRELAFMLRSWNVGLHEVGGAAVPAPEAPTPPRAEPVPERVSGGRTRAAG